MGEAKRRGDFVARKAAAEQRRVELYTELGFSMEPGISHLVLVFDGSQEGNRALQQAFNEYPAFYEQAVLADRAQFPILVYVHEVAGSGHFTVLCRNPEALQETVIPGILRRLSAAGPISPALGLACTPELKAQLTSL